MRALGALVTLAMLGTACGTGAETGSTAQVATTGTPTTTVDSTPTTSDDAGLAAVIEGLPSPALPASFPLDSRPPPDEILVGLGGIDWAAVFEGDDPAAIRSRLVAAVQQATEPGSAEVPRPRVHSARDRRLRGGSAARHRVDGPESTSKSTTHEFDNGTVAGTLTGTEEVTLDLETARRTIVLTVSGEAVDSATGETKHAELVLRFEHDLCWNEDGTRTGTYEQSVTVTVRGDGPAETSSESRSAGASDDPWSPGVDFTWGASRDSHSASASGTYPGGMGPGGATSQTGSGQGNERYEWENGYSMETTGLDPETIAELAQEVGDFNNFTAEFAFAMPPSRVEWVDFCLRVTVVPETASLEPGGEVLGITVEVRDWTDTPLPDAEVRVTQATLGALTGPTSGTSDHNGAFGTLYTSDREGAEELLVPVTYAGFEQIGDLTIQIGPAWALTMTMDIENVTFLWDGTFRPGEALFDGDGIGTVLGEGNCQVTGSGGTYTGPIAEISGTYTFSIEAEHASEEDGEWFTIEVNSTKAEVEFSYEDPVCGDFKEIARDFLELVPTLTNARRVPPIIVQVSDGYGTTDVSFDPYVLEVEVTKLGTD